MATELTEGKSVEQRRAEDWTWAHQAGQEIRYLIPPARMDEPWPFLTNTSPVPGTIGYQCTGMNFDAVYQDGRVLMGNYFSPCIKDNQIVMTQDGGRELKSNGVIAWAQDLYGVDHRCFPTSKPHPRMQVVVADRDGSGIFCSRNGETDGLFHLQPYQDEGGRTRYKVVGKLILRGDNKPDHYIESATIDDANRIVVLRSRQDGSPVWLERYYLDDGTSAGRIEPELLPPPSPMVYGIGVKGNHYYYVTSQWDGLTVEPGVYRGPELVLPGFRANGITFDPRDGSAYCPQYNDGVGSQGSPCYIFRIPGSLLR